MSDFGAYGGSEEDHASVRRCLADVEADSDNFTHWEALIRSVEALEGGLNRNSSPTALASFRDAYDRLLTKFPLFFGYWKKYADLEFQIAGTESADMVYERGVASITHSVDLWVEYCTHKMNTTHDPVATRELFERGAACIGMDFLAHPFWDKYIEFETRSEAQDRVFALYMRAIRIPMHQYARYFENFRNMCQNRPLEQVVTVEELARLRSEVEAEAQAQGAGPRPELEIERSIRAKIDATYYEVLQATQAEVQKRWSFESEIKRPYFHVTELEHGQLANWRKYLEFEEGERDFSRIVCLYERCLVSCALYDEFWFRYVRWMSGQPGKQEEVRNIYIRASTLFVPVSRPGIRLQWAYFEESQGRIDIALDIHQAILTKLPDCVEVITSWANMQRRQSGLDAAAQVYKDHIDAPTVDLFTKAAIVAEWAILLAKGNGDVKEARAKFVKNAQWYADSRIFWEKWFDLELQQPAVGKQATEQAQHVRRVFDELRSRSRLAPSTKKELCRRYLDFLISFGDKKSMKTYMEVDREMFGPPTVAAISKSSSDIKENGAAQGEMDPASKYKAETVFLRFFELDNEPPHDAQGTADFN